MTFLSSNNKKNIKEALMSIQLTNRYQPYKKHYSTYNVYSIITIAALYKGGNITWH